MDQFPLFPLFPPEIRNQIWHFAALVPRRITIGDYNVSREQYLLFGRRQAHVDYRSSLALLLGNKEARSIVESSYYDVFYDQSHDVFEINQQPDNYKKRKIYINQSLDTLCIVGFVDDSYFYPRRSISTNPHLDCLKFLEIDHVMRDAWQYIEREGGHYSSTDEDMVAKAIPNIRSIASSLEIVVVRPRRLDSIDGPRKDEEEEGFTTNTIGYNHNDNTIFMLEALAFMLGMTPGKDPTNQRGLKLVGIFATDIRPDDRHKDFFCWQLPELEKSTSLKLGKASPETWNWLDRTQPAEFLRSAREVDEGGEGLWCFREVLGNGSGEE